MTIQDRIVKKMNRPPVLILSTGGTIVSAEGEEGLKPTFLPKELLGFVPEVNAYANFLCKTVGHHDSTNIHPEDWIKIADEIRFAHEKRYRGVVIIHGTDTMAYTAAMLSFMITNPKIPIVLTGAQKPIQFGDSDGKINLLNSVQFAVYGPPGIYIVFAGEVIKGVRASKVNTTSNSAFQSINTPPVARFKNVDYLGTPPMTIPIEKLTWPDLSIKETSFDVKIDPHVMTLKITPGFRPEWIEALCRPDDFHGLIIEGFGTGNIPNRDPYNLLPSLEKLYKAGIPSVILSLCPFGGVEIETYEVGRKAQKIGIIPGESMTKEAALTKLMWILGHTRKMNKIREMMTTNLAGEL